MSDKISTVIFKVDLQCKLCYKKIKKALCKLQDRGTIRSSIYDEKNNTVTVSGPSDPKKLIKKVCCKACNVIKDIQIVEEKKPDPPPSEPKKDEPEPPKPEPVIKQPEPVNPYPAPAWAPGPGCCCRPWYVAYYGGCRCCSCGCVYGPPGNYCPPQPPPVVCCGPPPQVNVYGGSSYCDGIKTCEFIYEEEPSTCVIM